MRIALVIFFLVSSFLQINSQGISEANLRKHITYLASDKLKGRGTSTKEEIMASKYLAGVFAQIKLLPKGNNGFFQDFTFRYNPNPHDTSKSNLAERKGRNVIGFLDNASEETIVIGAHYDHLGLGHDHNSLEANPEGKIHNGADDNASGTAGVLELARYFAENNRKEKYNFLFILFSGEELGLIGSKKFCENPTIDLKKVNYMINLDMIGRLNDSTRKLMIHGIGTSPAWGPLLHEIKHDFDVKYDSAGIGPSDHTSFYLKDIPVLFFFTGQHTDYHKPGDDADKINYKGEKQVLDYLAEIITASENKSRFQFTPTKNTESGKTRFKVTMGVMPDYSFDGKGMRIDGVTKDKPAEKAGLQKGDIIIKLGADEVTDVKSYMKALGNFNKGDTAKVSVLRNGLMQEFIVNF